jgi:hypothetical protein
MTKTTNGGSGQPAAEPQPQFAQTIFIVRNFEPGQVYRVVFITPDQAKHLPVIPIEALQIAIAPAGGI